MYLAETLFTVSEDFCFIFLYIGILAFFNCFTLKYSTRPEMEHAYAPGRSGDWRCDECRSIGRYVTSHLKKFAKSHPGCVIVSFLSIILVLVFIYALDLGWTYPGVWHCVFTVICAISSLFKRGWLHHIIQRRVAEKDRAKISNVENRHEEVELMGRQEAAELPNEGQESDPEDIPGNQFEGQEQEVTGCPGLQQGGNMTIVINAEVHHPQSYSPSGNSEESLSAAAGPSTSSFHDGDLPPALGHHQSSASTCNAASNCPAEQEEST